MDKSLTSTGSGVSLPVVSRTNHHDDREIQDAPPGSRGAADLSPRQAALAAGLGLLLLAVLAAIVNFSVLQKLVVAGDA
jgi:hypothetical protein